MLVVFVASALMAVCVELPANNLKKILLDRKDVKVLKSKLDENQNKERKLFAQDIHINKVH